MSSDGRGQPASEAPSIQPGQVTPERFSAFLEELARAPDVTPGLSPERYQCGQVVGRFRLLRVVGRGGFGVVLEAFDTELERPVAFKTIRPRKGSRYSAQASWLRLEATAAARLSHPNIVTLHDVGTGPGGPFLVLELLRGETLQERLGRGPLPPPEAVRVALDVARALAHAHESGVIHRDLKPSNVFLTTSGAAKVLDFGLAQVLGSSDLPDGGTPAFMAPEQWRSEEADPRTDLYALGVMLYAMLDGAPPYPAREAAPDGKAGGIPRPLRSRRVPRSLAALAQQLVSEERRDRPPDARSVLPTLERAERALSQPRRLPWAVAAVALVVTGLVGAGAWTLGRSLPPSPPPTRRVVVADIQNRTGDAELDGLSAFIVTSLEQSRSLAVVSRSQVRGLLGAEGSGSGIDEALAIRAGVAAGVDTVLVPSVSRKGEGFEVGLRALHPLSRATVFEVQETGPSRATLPALVDRVSARARGSLHERGADVEGSRIQVAEVVTPSLEALRHYFSGKDCLDRPARAGSWSSATEACLPDLRRAVEIDPGFALAHYQIAIAIDDGHLSDSQSRKAISAALANIQRAPPRDQGLIRAMASLLDGKQEQAVAMLEALLAEHPLDREALIRIAEIHFAAARYAAALPYLDRALEQDPAFEWAIALLPPTLGMLGLRDELTRRVAQWSALAPTIPILHAIADGSIWLGDHATAIDTARREVEAGGMTAASVTLAAALFAAGDLEEAAGVLEPLDGAPAAVRRTVVARARGRVAESLAVAEDFRKRYPSQGDSYHLMRGAILTGSGDADGVLEECRMLRATSPETAATLGVGLAYLGRLDEAAEARAGVEATPVSREIHAALAEWHSGRPDPAKARLRALEEVDPRPRGLPPPGFLRAEIAASQGQDGEVIEAIQRYRKIPNMGIWQSWMQPRSLYLLARSYLRLGQTSPAREALDRLTRQFEGADADAPLQAELVALRGEMVRAGNP